MFSRTLTSVYDAILEDLVYPVEIVGKRIRVKLDGSQLIKVHLDKNEQTNIEHKVYLFSFLYTTVFIWYHSIVQRLTIFQCLFTGWYFCFSVQAIDWTGYHIRISRILCMINVRKIKWKVFEPIILLCMHILFYFSLFLNIVNLH